MGIDHSNPYIHSTTVLCDILGMINCLLYSYAKIICQHLTVARSFRIFSISMAKWRIRTIIILAVIVCAVGVIFMSNTPALQINHYWKENRNSLRGRFTISERTSTSVSLETNDTSERRVSESTISREIVSERGYMLALNYYDQIISGSINLQSLMCLAKKIGGVQVVEPFVMGSLLGLNVSANWTEEVRMSDIFDYDAWKRRLPFKKYGELVSFKNFLQNAPPKLLMVQYCMHGDFCYPCKHDDIILKSREFCKLHDFELVGHECFTDSCENKTMNLSLIQSRLYSKYNKSEVVVMFDLYGGIRSRYEHNPHAKPFRFFADIKDCGRDKAFTTYALEPSQLVLSDADKYIQTYLNSSAYIAVMIRMEKVFIQAKIAGNKHWRDQPSLAKQCFTNVLQRLEAIKKTFGADQVFVTIDIGHFGSLYFHKKNDAIKAVEQETDYFLSTIYGRNMTLDEYEERHIRSSRLINPGYMSVVQKEIAARGKVLLLVGGNSGYQSSTRKLYDQYHKNRDKYVFMLSTHCTVYVT